MEKGMAQTEIKKTRSVNERRFMLTERDIVAALFVAAGIFIGRVLVFDYMNPAVVAYLSVFLGSAGIFYITCLAALAGLVTNFSQVALIEYLSAIAILGAANYFITQNRVTLTDVRKCVIGAGCVLAGGIASAALDGLNIYIMLISAVEAVVTLSLCYIFIIAHRTISQSRKPVLTNEQLISVSALMGVCFVGMAGISVEGIYLRDVLSLSAVLILSFAGGAGAGAACGLIFSIIMFAGAKYPAAYTGILGVAGIAGGIFNDFGKLGSAAGFAIGVSVTALYLDRSIITPELFITLAVSGAAFLLLPKKIMDKVAYCFIQDGALEYEEYIEKIKEITSDRLKGFSDSFKLLSSTFSNLSDKKDGMTQKDVSALIDKIAQSSCKGCSRFDSCWKDNFYATYQAVFVLLGASDKKGYIAARDIPQGFRDKCIDIENFIEITNRVFLIYKTDVKWHNRIIESRELVSQQLDGVADIMADLSKELKFLTKFNDKFERIIRELLEKQRIGVDSVIVLENKYGRYEVDITGKAGVDMRLLGKNVINAVSEVLGRKMSRENSVVMSKGRGARVKIVEAQRFNVTTGVARVAKKEVSGDNYTWMELKNGRSVIALSDGMGTGALANEESKATIEILEQFLESGFDKELAIKMINSILVLKSDEDFFTTLDLLCIDLYTGLCEIVKIGAVETFLLRDGKVKVIRQSGLPVGIVSELDVETATLSLKDGDIMLVVSDGITDAGQPDTDSSWVADALADYKSVNPQYIADYIMERAKGLSGKQVNDDMTALALRVWVK